MLKNILITGGTGFIGRNLIEKLKEDYNLIVIGRKEVKESLGYKYYKCDVAKLQDIDNVFKNEKIDQVIHLATYYTPFHKKEDISIMIDTNVKGINNILELALLYKVEKVINTGSCFEYGNSNEILKEKDIVDPWNLYATTKILAEDIINYYCKKGLNAITLRLFPPFGLWDNPNKLIPFVIKSALKNKEIPLTFGEQKWDYTYSKDIAEAYRLALQTTIKGHEIINISNNNPISLKEIVEKIIGYTYSKSKVLFGAVPYRENEIMYLHGDNSKAKEILKWSPKYTFDKALRETIEFFKVGDINGNF
jgi:nucleoside-diphosphate-sugar epimerase